tara:strand:- start:514 stop:627 length:114 start_codon:yes stop_codon:yes gene_type:complete
VLNLGVVLLFLLYVSICVAAVGAWAFKTLDTQDLNND